MTCDRKFADRLIEGGGRIDPEDSPENPWVEQIVEYTTPEGELAYGCTFEGEDQSKYLRESEFIRNPQVFWQRNLKSFYSGRIVMGL